MLVLHRPDSARAGFSLVDVCVALVVVAISLGVLIGSVFHAMQLEQANEETAMANEQIRSLFERISATDFQDIYRSYNSTKDDDPDPGVDLLAQLTAANQDPWLVLGKRTGPVVTVHFPGDEGHELREDVEDASLGMPRDLNGDNKTDDQDHSADYVLLPITLRLEWEGSGGSRSLEMSTLLRRR